MSCGWERELGSGQRRQLPQTTRVICQREFLHREKRLRFSTSTWTIRDRQTKLKTAASVDQERNAISACKKRKDVESIFTRVVVCGQRWTVKLRKRPFHTESHRKQGKGKFSQGKGGTKTCHDSSIGSCVRASVTEARVTVYVCVHGQASDGLTERWPEDNVHRRHQATNMNLFVCYLFIIVLGRKLNRQNCLLKEVQREREEKEEKEKKKSN